MLFINKMSSIDVENLHLYLLLRCQIVPYDVQMHLMPNRLLEVTLLLIFSSESFLFKDKEV